MTRNANQTNGVTDRGPIRAVSTARAGLIARAGVVALLCVTAVGCHDGPLYGLKYANPYFTMREWKRDRALGVTDHERREELQLLAKQVGGMGSKDQAFWSNHLEKIVESDPSAEMRRLAVLAAGELKTPDAMSIIETGLDDESLKVQMESCRSLGKRPEPEAAQMLAATLGTTSEQDVRNSAIAALGEQKGSVAIDSLRLVLQDQNPATVDLAMDSLRGVMGKDYGNDPQQWIAAIDARETPPAVEGDGAIRFAERDEESTIR